MDCDLHSCPYPCHCRSTSGLPLPPCRQTPGPISHSPSSMSTCRHFLYQGPSHNDPCMSTQHISRFTSALHIIVSVGAIIVSNEMLRTYSQNTLQSSPNLHLEMHLWKATSCLLGDLLSRRHVQYQLICERSLTAQVAIFTA